MRESFKYVNCTGEVIEFGKSPYFAMENDLRDFAYEITSTNGLRYARGEVTKTLPIKLINATAEEKNYLYNVVQKDLMSGVYGTIWIGDYYYKCNIYASKKELYTNASELRIELKTYSKVNTWYKEEKTVFIKASDDEMEDAEEYRKYPYAYPYGYGKSNENSAITNNFGYACGFRFTIYGPATNPVINVNGHMYKVSCVVADGEYLTILSTDNDKLIYLTQNDGTQVNKFANRDKTSYIFEKIQNGISDVLWDGDFAFDITLIDERGEPAWI